MTMMTTSTIRSVLHHPWRHLAENHPTVRVVWACLSGGARGYTDGQRIWIDPRLTQAQRRVTVCHETIHIERGFIPADDAEERIVEQLTAERLITTGQLVDAIRWHRSVTPGTLVAIAETLWVDAATVQCRLDTMTGRERGEVADTLRRLAA